MPYKVAIVGCGLIAGRDQNHSLSTHAGTILSSKDLLLTSVVDTNDSNLTDFCSQYPCQSFHDLEDCFETTSPDIVSICTPDETHLK